MSNTTHTPVPWTVQHTGGRTEGVVCGNHCYATVEGKTYEDRKTVATLIASAPDLLAALEEAKRMLETASRYFPKSIKNPDRFSLLNVLANAIDPAIAAAKGGGA